MRYIGHTIEAELHKFSHYSAAQSEQQPWEREAKKMGLMLSLQRYTT
jgi:hypothetical protein